MNIVFVSQNYWPSVGGIETHVRQVAHALRNRGHAVRVVVGTLARAPLPPKLAVLHESLLAPTANGYDDDGVPVLAMSPRGPIDRLRLLPAAVRAIPRLQRHAYHGLARFAHRFAFDPVYRPRLVKWMAEAEVVHSMAGGALGWTAERAARVAGVPLVVTPFVHPHQWGDGPDDIDFYRRVDAVVGLVESDRKYLQSVGVLPERLHTIGVSPDLPESADANGFRHRYELGGAPLILYVGRMTAAKGAAAVLAAAQIVWAAAPDARFVFIGPASPDEAAMFARVDSRVRYLGKVSLQEKADALAACDVFCMPSTSEILPTVYLEAWSYGKPVIGGQAPGLPELIEGNLAGFAVSHNPADVANALVRLLGEPAISEEMGRAGRRLVERCYSVAVVAGQLEHLYQAVAEKFRRREVIPCVS